jgi:hypothetical protein
VRTAQPAALSASLEDSRMEVLQSR